MRSSAKLGELDELRCFIALATLKRSKARHGRLGRIGYMLRLTNGDLTEFHYPKGSLLGILSASYWVGNVLGVLFITPLSDRFGRRMAMFFGSVVAILGTGLCTGAINGMLVLICGFA